VFPGAQADRLAGRSGVDSGAWSQGKKLTLRRDLVFGLDQLVASGVGCWPAILSPEFLAPELTNMMTGAVTLYSETTWFGAPPTGEMTVQLEVESVRGAHGTRELIVGATVSEHVDSILAQGTTVLRRPPHRCCGPGATLAPRVPSTGAPLSGQRTWGWIITEAEVAEFQELTGSIIPPTPAYAWVGVAPHPQSLVPGSMLACEVLRRKGAAHGRSLCVWFLRPVLAGSALRFEWSAGETPASSWVSAYSVATRARVMVSCVSEDGHLPV
jgi:hypothetical protein